MIFYYTPEQKAEAEASDKAAQTHFSAPIVTQFVAADSTKFWKAEDYHQHYDDKNGVVCKPVLVGICEVAWEARCTRHGLPTLSLHFFNTAGLRRGLYFRRFIFMKERHAYS